MHRWTDYLHLFIQEMTYLVFCCLGFLTIAVACRKGSTFVPYTEINRQPTIPPQPTKRLSFLLAGIQCMESLTSPVNITTEE